jgi:DNA-directed RNA polymerase subunit M/transcription elongation factor TFIIS
MATPIEFIIPDIERKNSVKKIEPFFKKKIYAQDLERGIYDFTKSYCESDEKYLLMNISIYKDKLKDILFNLADKTNDTIESIIKDINNENISANCIAFKTPDELNRKKWSKIKERFEMTEAKLHELPTVEWRRCKICKGNKYFFDQMQTRSADEPMTTYYYCKTCKKVYKINN